MAPVVKYHETLITILLYYYVQSCETFTVITILLYYYAEASREAFVDSCETFVAPFGAYHGMGWAPIVRVH